MRGSRSIYISSSIPNRTGNMSFPPIAIIEVICISDNPCGLVASQQQETEFKMWYVLSSFPEINYGSLASGLFHEVQPLFLTKSRHKPAQ
jgi:hypothetical protein